MPGIQLRQERNIYSVVVQLRAKLRRSGMLKVPDSFYRLENITLIVDPVLTSPIKSEGAILGFRPSSAWV
jgi:hypothetical protein